MITLTYDIKILAVYSSQSTCVADRLTDGQTQLRSPSLR